MQQQIELVEAIVELTQAVKELTQTIKEEKLSPEVLEDKLDDKLDEEESEEEETVTTVTETKSRVRKEGWSDQENTRLRKIWDDPEKIEQYCKLTHRSKNAVQVQISRLKAKDRKENFFSELDNS